MSDRVKIKELLKDFEGTFEDFVFLFVDSNKNDFPNKRIENIVDVLNSKKIEDND